MPVLNGQVGPLSTTSSLSSGSQPAIRLGNMGDQIQSKLHGDRYEASYRRALFAAANQSAVTTSAALSTTYVGICLSNPIGSTVNLVLNEVGTAFLVAFGAASAVGLMLGYNSSTNVTHTTPITPRSQFFGVGASPQALVDASATLPTAPVVNTIFGAGLTGAITTSTQTPMNVHKIEGGIILPPGAYACVYTSTASGSSSFFGSFQWEEVPF